MASIARLPVTVLASILRPLIIQKIPLSSVRTIRGALGITNPLRELTHVYRVVKAQLGKMEQLKEAPSDRVINPGLFVPSLGSLSKKFMYVVNLVVNYPGLGISQTETVSILSSRRMTKKTALTRAIDRYLNPPPESMKCPGPGGAVIDGDVIAAVDRDL